MLGYLIKAILLQGGVVLRSHTKPPRDLTITRLRVILKILWPYKDPFAALKQWPLDLINTHLRSPKKRVILQPSKCGRRPYAQMVFFRPKMLNPFSGPIKRDPKAGLLGTSGWPCSYILQKKLGSLSLIALKEFDEILSDIIKNPVIMPKLQELLSWVAMVYH